MAGTENAERIAGAGPNAEAPGELSPEALRGLFMTVCWALAFDALRLKPREKQLALLLASESFGEGSAHGAVDLPAWRLRLATWRSNELKDMLAGWRRAGWLAVDVTEATFRLAPDRFPGWADVQVIQRSEVRARPLNLTTEDDLHKTFAKLSQAAAVAKISYSGGRGENVSETFNRLTSERLNVPTLPAAEPTKLSQRGQSPEAGAVQALRHGVREFVGEADWGSPEFWNNGQGWRGRLFLEEFAALEGALSYCVSALTERNSTVRLKKTRGAMLWNEFQRLRREAMR